MYAPPVSLDEIANVKKAVSIPVIGNGDIVDGKSAKLMLDMTGCDFLMVGRGALGNPWIFQCINAYLNKEADFTEPTLEEKWTSCSAISALFANTKACESACAKRANTPLGTSKESAVRRPSGKK